MRVVFFGTPEPAVVALDAIAGSGHDLAAVITQPDKPRGRGRGVSASPVKERAGALGVECLQPPSPKDPAFIEHLRALAPDIFAIVAYGHILSRALLEVAPALNAHFSLLPRYRGAAPVQRALMDGATETGVSVFILEPTVDTGPVLARERVAIDPDENAGELLARLAPIGARLLVAALDAYPGGQAEVQSGRDASPAPKIRPEECIIDWTDAAPAIANRVRALAPRPGAYTFFGGKRLLILRARACEGVGPPGGLLASPDGAIVATGAGALAPLEVQREGKTPMSWDAFLRGSRPQPGEVLGATR